MLTMLKKFIREEEGVGTVEMILILAVLIGLVVLFKNQLTTLVTTTLSSINEKASSI